VVFQGRELRTLPAPPIFNRSQQSSTDSLILVPAANRDLRDVTRDDFSVHCIGRLFESDVYESNDLTTELRNKSDGLSIHVGRMLPAPLGSVPILFQPRGQDSVQDQGGRDTSTFRERPGDTVTQPDGS